MADQRLQSRDKKVQKMTRDGLVEENLSDKSTVRVSHRAGDVKLERKHHLESEERMGSQKTSGQTRDAPDKGRKRRLQISEDEIGARDALEDVESSSDYAWKSDSDPRSRKKDEKKLKQKRRLQFTDGETGAIAGETAEGSSSQKQTSHNGVSDTESSHKASKNSKRDIAKKNTMKRHHGKEKIQERVKPSEEAGKNLSKLRFGAVGSAVANGKKITDAAYGEEEQEEKGRLRSHSARALKMTRKRGSNQTNSQVTSLSEKAYVNKRFQEALSKDEKLKHSSFLKKQRLKAQIKREYAKAKRAELAGNAPKGTIEAIKKLGGKVTDFFKEHKKVYMSLAAFVIMFFLLISSITSCSTIMVHNIANYMGASYMSADEDIRDADLYYTKLETDLEERIKNMESEEPGYDIYRYHVDDIGHDPFVLISYLSAKYEVFEFDSTIKAELDALFARQYTLKKESSTETSSHRKTVRVGESLGNVVTSGYCNCFLCCGIWAGGATASGVMPRENHTIAVDAHTPTVPMGTKIIMNGREYVVEDTGNFTRYGVDFDVYYEDHNRAEAHGHKTWEAFIADDNGSREVEVLSTSTDTVLTVTLENHGLESVCLDRLDIFQKGMYEAYMESKGNLQMFRNPLEINWYPRISDYYGWRIHPHTGENRIHNGVDIPMREGTPVKAGLEGVVTRSFYDGGNGNCVAIKDKYGFELEYHHLLQRNVNVGDQVKIGDIVGLVGNTGLSGGAHLHVELKHNGVRLNPLFYIESGQ